MGVSTALDICQRNVRKAKYDAAQVRERFAWAKPFAEQLRAAFEDPHVIVAMYFYEDGEKVWEWRARA